MLNSAMNVKRLNAVHLVTLNQVGRKLARQSLLVCPKLNVLAPKALLFYIMLATLIRNAQDLMLVNISPKKPINDQNSDQFTLQFPRRRLHHNVYETARCELSISQTASARSRRCLQNTNASNHCVAHTNSISAPTL